MAHELAGALQQACRIRQRCAVKEPHVYVRREYVDVAEGRISQTCNRAAVMQKLPDFVPAFSHHLKPLMRDGSQFTCMLFHPRIDGGIPLDSAVEAQEFRFHRGSTFFFRDLRLRSLHEKATGLACRPSSADRKSINGSLLRLCNSYDPSLDGTNVVFRSQQDLQPPHPGTYRNNIADFRKLVDVYRIVFLAG